MVAPLSRLFHAIRQHSERNFKCHDLFWISFRDDVIFLALWSDTLTDVLEFYRLDLVIKFVHKALHWFWVKSLFIACFVIDKSNVSIVCFFSILLFINLRGNCSIFKERSHKHCSRKLSKSDLWFSYILDFFLHIVTWIWTFYSYENWLFDHLTYIWLYFYKSTK